MFAFVVLYMNTTGPMAWIYAAETTIDVGLGFCLGTLYMWVFILSLVSPVVMQPNYLGPSVVFYIFSAFSFIAVIFIYTFLKETKGLSDKEKKEVFKKK